MFGVTIFLKKKYVHVVIGYHNFGNYFFLSFAVTLLLNALSMCIYIWSHTYCNILDDDIFNTFVKMFTLVDQ